MQGLVEFITLSMYFNIPNPTKLARKKKNASGDLLVYAGSIRSNESKDNWLQ